MDTYEGNVNKIFSLLFYVVLVLASYSLTRIGLVELLNMSYHGIDFCLYDNAIWNAAQGTWLHCALKHSWSYLGTHFSPILFLFVPFYRLGAGPWFLILVRSAAMAGGALLIRYYALKHARLSEIAADIIGISYLLHPMVHMATLSEFHGVILELFFIPLFFVAIGSKKKWFVWCALFLLLSVREDTWIYTAGASLLILWKDDKKLARSVFFVSVFWGLAALFVFMPFFQRGVDTISQGNAQLSSYLSRYGRYFSRGVGTFFLPRFLADLKLMFPLMFLPLFGGRYLLLMLMPLLQIQMGQIRYQISLLSHYSACILPFTYIAAVHGWKNIESYIERKKPFFLKGRRMREVILAFVVVVCSVAGLRGSIVLKKKLPIVFQKNLIHLREKTAFEILKSIPPRASLSLQGSLMLIGSHRPRVYLFSGYPPKTGYPSQKTEYVMVDLGRDFSLVRHYRLIVADLLKSGEYGVSVYKDGFVLLRKGYDTRKNKLVLHEMFFKIQGEHMHYRTGRWEEGTKYDWKAARVARQGRDHRGGLAFGIHRILGPGRYNAVFSMFLSGKEGVDAATLVIKARAVKGKTRVLIKKVVKFFPKRAFQLFSLTLAVKKRTIVEPLVFYGGVGVVGLDYIEFNRV